MDEENTNGESSSATSQNDAASSTTATTTTTSNNHNNRSLANDNNLASSSSSAAQRPSSSTTRQHSVGPDDYNTDSPIGDDIGWWDCSLCTYRNSADKFKCEICDLRRGTSTRKPRCNKDTIVAQVVKQQEQIRQQTRVSTKAPKSRSSTSGTQGAATTSTNDTTITNIPKSKNSKKSARPSDARTKPGSSRADTDPMDLDSDTSSWHTELEQEPDKKRKKLFMSKTEAIDRKLAKISKQEQKNRGDKNNNVGHDDDDSSTESDTTDPVSSTSLSSLSSSESDSSSSSSSVELSPKPTTSSPLPQTNVTENPFKITPLEISGNIIKYSPPTSSGRTGLIIDKKRFTQHSVTVNDITITFTEFATRQNKYIRKKKKKERRCGAAIHPFKHGNGVKHKNIKVEPKSSQNASTTAAEDA